MSSIVRRLWLLVTRSRYDRELKEEISFHVEARERELIADGVAVDEARFRAQREFGNTLRIQERSRRSVMFWWEWIVQDLRFGLRMIRKAPGFTAVIVVSMAIAIGATTSIFSVLNAMVLRQLAVRAPGEMYLFAWSVPKQDFPGYMISSLDGSFVQEKDGRYRSYSVSHPMYEAMRQQQSKFEDLFAFSANSLEVNIGVEGRSYPGLYVGVSGNYFNSAGVVPVRGRILGESDDTQSSPPVAMISYRFWMELGGGDVVGKQAVVNGQPITIVGVAPAGFVGFDPSVKTDFFVPLSFYIRDYDRLIGPYVTESGTKLPSFAVDERSWWLTVGGRVKPNVNVAAAAGELNSIFNQQIDNVAKSRPHGLEAPLLEVRNAQHGMDTVRMRYQSACLILLGLVSVVLLIACANVSALLLARATARQREMAQRLSVGASRSRIVWQLLTESILLSSLGAIAGLLLAYWSRSGLAALISDARDTGSFEIHMDARVLLFALGITFLSGIMFGVVPAVQVSRTDPMSALKLVPGTTRTEKGHWPGKLLVAGQLALALLLMVGAVLFGRTLREFGKMELGFDQQNLVLFNVRPGLNGYEGTKLEQYYEELRRRLEAIPGVAKVTVAQRGPIGQGAHITIVSLPGAVGPAASGNYQGQAAPSDGSKKGKNAYVHIVSGGYFDTLRIPIISGRGIEDADGAQSHKVAVVNREFVKQYLNGQTPLGLHLKSGKSDLEIVGVASDVKYARLREKVPPTMYVSFRQRETIPQNMAFLLRVNGGLESVLPAVQREAAAVDPAVPVDTLETEQAAIDRSLFTERTFTLLSSSFAGIALVLACVGLYGTLSYMVVRRTNEIGVRMALGAQRRNIVQMVMRDGWKMALLGVAVGIPLALTAAKLIESQIYGISARDPLSLVLAVASVLSIALIVGLLPAWKASRVDPMVALKYE